MVRGGGAGEVGVGRRGWRQLLGLWSPDLRLQEGQAWQADL